MRKPNDTSRIDKLERIEFIARRRKYFYIGAESGAVISLKARKDLPHEEPVLYRSLRDAIDAAPEPGE